MDLIGKQFNCEVCKKEFHRTESDNMKSEHFFCSKVCYYIWQRQEFKKKNLYKNCEFCHKEFKVFPKQYETKRFCSKQCVCDSKKIWIKCEWCKKGYFQSPSQIKRYEHNFCCRGCYTQWQLVNRGQQEVECFACHKKFMRRGHFVNENRNFCSLSCMNGYFKGDNSPNYKDGRSSIAHLVRESVINYKWIFACFTRDNFMCQHCKIIGKKLNCHHITSFANLIRTLNVTKENYQDEKISSQIFNIDNGITLCKKCHKEFHNIYGFSTSNEQLQEFLC